MVAANFHVPAQSFKCSSFVLNNSWSMVANLKRFPSLEDVHSIYHMTPQKAMLLEITMLQLKEQENEK